MTTIDDMKVGEEYCLVKNKNSGNTGFVAEYIDTRKKIQDENGDEVYHRVAIKRLERIPVKMKNNELQKINHTKKILREIRILNTFEHENVINLERVIYKETDNEFGDIYLVSELMDSNLSNTMNTCSGELDNDHKKWIMYQIFNAFKYIHSAKVIHKDIRPNNIL